MKDFSDNKVDIKIEFNKLPEIVEYIKQLKRERDYYKKIVEKRCDLFVIEKS